jgi:hypothetical protein
MLTRIYSIFLGLGVLSAQQVVAPTPEQVGSPRGENSGDYNVTDSFETGYRFAEVAGNVGEYRADVNYGNGIRLLGSSLTVDSKDGHGRFFDEILLNTLGLGNDPYQSVTLRIRKNGLYQYDMLWRLDDYFNPGLVVSGGAHLLDTGRRLQDHDLTLLPQSRLRVHLGYSRDTQDGPALSTVQEFTTPGEPFPVFEDVRRQWNEYRLGVDLDLAGFKLTLLHRWDFYKDDSLYNLSVTEGSPLVNDLTELQQFQRTEPYHGANPGWLGNLSSIHKHWGINARMTYASGQGDYALNEYAAGLSRLATAANQQIQVSGNAQRPLADGDFSFSWFPTDNLTVVNNTSAYNLRINGDSFYTQFNNGLNFADILAFEYLGIRTVGNSTDARYRLRRWLSIHGGYHYSARLIRDIEAAALPPFSLQPSTYQQENHQNAGVIGARIQPFKPLTINLDAEIGRADHPFTPVSDRDYHSLFGRVEYRLKKLQLSTSYRQFYNTNSVSPISDYSSHSRNYSANAAWAPGNWFTLDASYMKMHVDSITGLAFFAGLPAPVAQFGYSSEYISNIHAANLGARFEILRRTELYVGYNITKDTGDGRAAAVAAGVTNPVQALLDSVQTFPLSFQSPLARLSVRISPKVRWNAGFEFYNYHEQFSLLGYYENYHANTGYTSVLWSF